MATGWPSLAVKWSPSPADDFRWSLLMQQEGAPQERAHHEVVVGSITVPVSSTG